MFKGRILLPEIDYESGRVIARALITAGNYREWFDQANKEKEFDLTIKQHRERRSLDANSYFHVLVGKIADKIGMRNSEAKNWLISEYGQMEKDENGKKQFLIVKDGMPVERWPEIHLRATTQTKELNGILYRVYIVMRGSHTYDTKEMSRLIEGAVYEAKEAGIPEAEIMSPREKDLLRDVYGIEVAQ